MIKINIQSELELARLAERIALIAKMQDVFFLEGDLGVGKTSFARAFIRQRMYDRDLVVSSPTFNIMHVYDQVHPHIYHYDLYRVENSADLDELGLDEFLSAGISLIEWPSKLVNYRVDNPVKITISFTDQSPSARVVEFSASEQYIKNIQSILPDDVELL